MRLTVPVPPAFSFRRTVLSHGWCLLPPFEAVDRGRALITTYAVAGWGPRTIEMRPLGGAVSIETRGPVSPSERRAVEAAVRRMLALDVDVAPFLDAVRADPDLAWIVDAGAGRLLRAPSLFEDLVKLVLTTNCSWSLTTRMVRGIVDRYGQEAPGGRRAFPTPEMLAEASERDLRSDVRAGYRAPFVVSLAQKVAGGEVDLATWEDSERETESVRREMLEIPGVGPYVAENLLKFLGRPQGLALDSWMRTKYARLHHGGRIVTDRTISRRYARFGSWAALAIWFDLTRDWFEGEDPSPAWDALA